MTKHAIRRSGWGILITLSAILLSSYFLTQCNSSSAGSPEEGSSDAAYTAYVSGYSSGTLSSGSGIRIRFVEAVATPEQVGTEAPASLFSFSPSIKGKAAYEDANTILFTPTERLPSGQRYTASFELDDLMEVPSELSEFEFTFSVIQQNFEVNVIGVETYDDKDLTRQKVVGELRTADYMEGAMVENLLKATHAGKDKTLTWEHADGGRIHRFTVEDVKRQEAEGTVTLTWDGDPADLDVSGNQNVAITALGDFSVTDVHVVNGSNQYVSVRFSEPLQENQSLRGLFSLEGGTSLRYTVEGNEVKVYPSVPQTGQKELIISPGIKNILGYSTKQRFNYSLMFRQVKPDIRLSSSGTILPSTGSLTLPFEAVNLRAVEVSIVRIFEKNVGQFLQVNSLAGSREIKRVGRPVYMGDVPLTGTADELTEWQRYSLDLTDFIQAEPGAIYQVELNFRRSQSTYYCEGQENAEGDGLTATGTWDESEPQIESSYWDYADDYYDYQYYNWSEREDPCTDSYFIYKRSNRTIQQNVLASDLGLMAKMGAEGDLHVFATDLRTTKPLSGVAVTAYNYQQQAMATGNTNADGKVQLPMDGVPFLLMAEQGNQRGYLKLDNGSALSVSNFDVGGSRVQEGLKGFIYGERGVWRPGDTLFLSFILQDELSRLPANHPVVFELDNPMGQTVQRVVKTEGLNGFYRFTTKTETSAPTGNWLARIRVGGATFTKTLPIETIKPNRLKINLDFGVEALMAADATYAGRLNVTWLTGVKAGGLKARFKATLVQSNTTFDKYTDFEFDDPMKRFESEERVIFDGKVDANGEAVISGEFSEEPNAPGKLMAYFRGQVFEEGGDFSIDQFSIPYYPYSSFVGVKMPKGDAARGMLLTDTTQTVELRSVTAEGEASPNRTLDVEIYKLSWRWWWDNSSNSSNYMSGQSSNAVVKGTVRTDRQGMASWDFKIEYPEWGRYVVLAKDRESGHRTGKIFYIDWPGWAGRGQRENPGGESMLSFGTDKAEYTVGETVKLSIPSSGEGRALVSLETGSDVLATYWVATQKGETNFEFKTTGAMSPNVYVNVTLLQPHNQTANDLPIRLYGVTPIKVTDPATILNPVLEMADEIRPESVVKLKVREASGKPMTYTVAVVDEGLLDLTRYRTPNPWNNFYAREALGVRSWDLYEDVIGAYGSDLERILAIGGDDYDEEDSDQQEANRFKPVVRYFGPFTLEKGRSNEHTFQMPPYIGSVKTMIVAGQAGAYGATDKATPVRKPLMAQATLPRVLGPDETVRLPVNIFTLNDELKKVTVEVETNDLLTMVGSKTRTINFSEAGNQVVDFELKTAARLGVAKVKVIARSGNEEAEYEIELQVRNPNPYSTNAESKLIAENQTWNQNYTPIGMAGTNTVTLEVSRIPPIDMGRRLKYLIRYPHGCIEQTTSSVFPQLYLSSLSELDSRLVTQIEENIRAGIQRLRTFQTSDGGFAYWPGNTESSTWGSNYAGHFLLEAKAKGYNVPDKMLRDWRSFQRREANNWRAGSRGYRYDDLLQAYRLYTLALAGHPEIGAMNRLRETGELTLQAKWRLAAAYAAAGKNEVAEDIIQNLDRTVGSYRELSGSYGSHVRDEAMILETLTLMNKREDAVQVLLSLSKYMSDQGYWMSTQTTAYCLLAAGKFAAKAGDSPTMTFEYTLNGGSKVKASTELPVVQIDVPVKDAAAGNIQVVNTYGGELYARLIMQGQPVRSTETASQENVSITVRYKDLNGNSISVDRLAPGTEFLAEVEVYNPGTRGNLEEMALTQVFPSGWEIINTRMNNGPNVYQADVPEYLDIRDDRVYTYFDLYRGSRKTFTVLLNAAYSGKFYLPAVNCEAMYDNTINARTTGKEVVVTE